MKRRHFISLSCLGALALGAQQSIQAPPSTTTSWKSFHKVAGNQLRVRADQLVDCISQLTDITGSPVRAEGNDITYMEHGKEQTLTVALVA